MPITIYPSNILEGGTFTVETATPADTGYPEERLHDRSNALYWKFTGTGALNFHVDYGSAVEVDALFIFGHNFDGEDMQFQYSIDDFSADTNDAVTDWTQSGNDIIAQVMAASQTKRYWRATITSMTNPECSEVFMSLGYEFTVAAGGEQAEAEQSNISRIESIGGMPRTIKVGDKRKHWRYEITLKNQTDLDNWAQVIEDLDGMFKPFVIEDLDGNYSLMELLTDPEVVRMPGTFGVVVLDLLKVV